MAHFALVRSGGNGAVYNAIQVSVLSRNDRGLLVRLIGEPYERQLCPISRWLTSGEEFSTAAWVIEKIRGGTEIYYDVTFGESLFSLEHPEYMRPWVPLDKG